MGEVFGLWNGQNAAPGAVLLGVPLNRTPEVADEGQS
jgi:hypothetical protein